MRLMIILVLAVIGLSACGEKPVQAPSGKVERYELRGKVLSVDKPNKKASIEHEAIPGYMPKMTMDFPIKEDWVWEDLLPGVDIRAELVVDNTAKDPYWLEKVVIVAQPNPNLPKAETLVPAQVGKEVPPITLTNQDGKKISLADFKGKVLAITFIYAECPLPDACIKLSREFSDIALQLQNSPDYKDKIRLLSISFDPARDTPAKLKQYGTGYLGNPEKPDFTVWQLAVGNDKEVRALADFFGLKYEVDSQDKAVINHNLVTAVISPDGKIAKMLPGNRWDREELMRDLQSVADAK
ncbi:MAG: SCO family protein [Pyrinomonadaceae bacterium]|nr:SCO family protein [Pyrinomonadaceae bacterium]